MMEQTAALWSRNIGYLQHTHMGYVVPELEKTHPSWWAFERSGRKFLSDYQFKDPIDDTPSNRRLIADCLMDHFIFLAVVEKPGFHLRPRIPHKPDAIAHIISLSKHRHIHFILHPFTVKT